MTDTDPRSDEEAKDDAPKLTVEGERAFAALVDLDSKQANDQLDSGRLIRFLVDEEHVQRTDVAKIARSRGIAHCKSKSQVTKLYGLAMLLDTAHETIPDLPPLGVGTLEALLRATNPYKEEWEQGEALGMLELAWGAAQAEGGPLTAKHVKAVLDEKYPRETVEAVKLPKAIREVLKELRGTIKDRNLDRRYGAEAVNLALGQLLDSRRKDEGGEAEAAGEGEATPPSFLEEVSA